MIELVPIDSVPREAIEALLDAAFGGDRRQKTAYRLRAGSDPITALSFALVNDHANRLRPMLGCWHRDQPTGPSRPRRCAS